MIIVCTLTEEKIKKRSEEAERLLGEIADGSSDALESLYLLIKTDVYSYALSKLGNKSDAEDILQDTFVQIYKYSAHYRPMGKPLAWIFTIEQNLIKRKRIVESRSISLDDSIGTDLEPEALSHSERDVVAGEWVREVLSLLSEKEREVVTLYIISGMKHREIAEITGEPLSTVLSRYNRAIKKLKNAVKEDNR